MGLVAEKIVVRGARTHNLRNLDVDIPRGQLVVITGVSGSGKSSLAFDTLYAEGQRRYLDCLSDQARQFLEQLPRPPVERLEGLPPTICIEQRSGTAHARSTLATLTELHDYLRVLFARAGQAHCTQCGDTISHQSPQSIVDQILALESGRKVILLAPVIRGKKGSHPEIFEKIAKAGYVRARVDGEILDIADPPKLAKTKPHFVEAVVDRIIIKAGLRDRLDESVAFALRLGEGCCIVSEQKGDSWCDHLYSSRFACPTCGLSFPELEPRTFSFNSPHGACVTCHGLGVVPDRKPSIHQAGKESSARLKLVENGHTFDRLTSEETTTCTDCGGSRLQPLGRNVTFGELRLHQLLALTVAEAFQIVRDWRSALEIPTAESGALKLATTPLKQIAQRLLNDIETRLRFLNQVGVGYLSLDRRANTLSGGEFQRARLAGCLGSGLLGACFILDEPTIGLHPRDTQKLLATLRELRDQGASVLVVEHDLDVIQHADYIIDIGPGAGNDGGQLLACGTPAELILNPRSLTGAFLSRQKTITRTSSLAEAVARTSEHVDTSARLETPRLKQAPADRDESKFLTERLSGQGGAAKSDFKLTNVTIHNLKSVSVQIPFGKLVCVTGVSGSGKSSLVADALVPLFKDRIQGTCHSSPACGHLEGGDGILRLVEVDQSPLGSTGRSNLATYSGIWDEIRKIFGQTRESRARGFRSSRFSFNAAEGRCPACHGRGVSRSMFAGLSDLILECPACQGKRFNSATLEIKFHGLNVADILDLSVKDAAVFFQNFSSLSRMLDTFLDVGLGHLKLGQPATNLSGGESQRIKLASELGRGHHELTLFVLDEPTTGLHSLDIAKLLDLLQRLVDRGHGIVMVEHHLDLIDLSDWVIDLGPEGGAGGGTIVAEGPPAEIAAHAGQSHTGQLLKLRRDGSSGVYT